MAIAEGAGVERAAMLLAMHRDTARRHVDRHTLGPRPAVVPPRDGASGSVAAARSVTRRWGKDFGASPAVWRYVVR